jgi:hypothetical protein
LFFCFEVIISPDMSCAKREKSYHYKGSNKHNMNPFLFETRCSMRT